MKAKIKDNEQVESKSMVQSGIVQLLTSMRLCSPDKVEQCIKKLQQSTLVVSEVEDRDFSVKKEYYDERYEVLSDLSDVIEKAKDDVSAKTGIPKDLLGISMENKSYEELKKTSRVFIMDTLSVTVKDYLDSMIKDMNANIRHRAFSDLSRTDMLLQPITISKDSVETHLFIMFSLFENGLALLKIEYHIDAISIENLSKSNLSIDFDTVELPLCFNDNTSTKFGYSLHNKKEDMDYIDSRNTHLLSNHQIDDIIKSFDDVVTTKESINKERSGTLLAWLGIVLSLILSFTGVRDILDLINEAYMIIDTTNKQLLFLTTIIVWLSVVLVFVLVSFIPYLVNKIRK